MDATGAAQGNTREEGDRRLAVLVNDVWGGDELADWQRPFWAQSLEDGLRLQERAVWSHLITSRYGAPLLVARGRGLIVEVTDGLGYSYRGSLTYSLVKVSVIHLAEGMAKDLRTHGAAGVTALAVSPGYLRSEVMLDGFGVTEANWRDAIAQDPDFARSETPYYLGRGVAALAGDPDVGDRAGQTLASCDLAREYGFTDTDGTQPIWKERRRIE
jgi:NAD(P)-dependent dehydrogenase (short-subunit alcohol dehydrogenase family)